MRFQVVCFALTGLLALTGCTESGKLEVDGRVAQTTQALTSAASLELANGTLVIDRARIAVSEIELEGGDEEREAEFGPAVITLELDGSPTVIAASTVEAGSYDTIGLELSPRVESASILVDGSYEGAPFSFRSDWSPEIEFPLDPEVVVPANGEARAGITFDLAEWFLSEDGSALDPTDAANQSRIQDRIAESMTAKAVEIELEGDDD